MAVFAIVLGIIIAVAVGKSPLFNALMGGVVGWLLWKVARLEEMIRTLQTGERRTFETTSRVVQQKAAPERLADREIATPREAGPTVRQLPGNYDELDEWSQDWQGAEKRETAPVAVDSSPALRDRPRPAQAMRDEPDWPSDNPLGERLNAFLAWFAGGNMLVRVGSIVLLFGAGFLLKYAAEHSHLSIQVRMIGIVLGALLMIGIGWRLRASRPAYAMALQGGGLGLLYLTIYASYRLYDLLAPGQALILLALVAAAGIAMAVVYDALWLAILSFAGGFLAPLLASTGSGNHVALFSWYAVLNVGIAILAWHKAWRSLNLLGMVATFVIGAMWGYQYYRSELFDSVEPFLVGFGLLYLGVGIVFSLHRADPEQKGFGRVDASIVFGTPVGFFLLQTPLVHDFEHGMSLSTLLAAIVYAMAAGIALRGKNPTLTTALLSIAVALFTLTIPLEFDATETAAAWAMEGAGLLWLGCRQTSLRAIWTGLALQGLAAVSWQYGAPLHASLTYGSALSAFLIALSGWVCAAILARQYPQRDDWPDLNGFMTKSMSFALQCWGLFWWVLAGATELQRHWQGHDLLLADMGWITLSAWVVEILGGRMGWHAFRNLNQGLPLVWLGALAMQFEYVNHPLQGWAPAAWIPALLTTCWLMYRADRRQDAIDQAGKEGKDSNLFHIAAACFTLLFIIWELHWQVGEWMPASLASPIWKAMVPGVVPALLMLLLVWGDGSWPVVAHRASYLRDFNAICTFIMFGWYVWMLPNPVQYSLPYLPLLNPPDVVLGIIFLAAFAGWRAMKEYDLVQLETRQLYWVAGLLAFVWFNVDVARTVHHWFAVAWNEYALGRSFELQAALSLSWSVLAMILMHRASRRGFRTLWFAGGALLALVVLKLFVVDLSGTGTLARIISFLGAGGLLLIIGYMSPVPPADSEAEAASQASDAGVKKASQEGTSEAVEGSK